MTASLDGDVVLISEKVSDRFGDRQLSRYNCDPNRGPRSERSRTALLPTDLLICENGHSSWFRGRSRLRRLPSFRDVRNTWIREVLLISLPESNEEPLVSATSRPMR